jgi:SAM-dependent methyltransferase
MLFMLGHFIHSKVLPQIRVVRGSVVRLLKPKSGYSLFPISNNFGFDRGRPVDRYYIENFLQRYVDRIRGVCLEVHDDAYTKRFGGEKVTRVDVVDVDRDNSLANIYVDLADAAVIPDNTYDCLIITHTIGLIPEHEKAVGHLYRILKPGGTLVLTVSALGPFIQNGNAFWRYTTKSVQWLLEKYFAKESIEVTSMGNALAGQAFWVGMACEDLTPEQLEFTDMRYPVVIAAVATK